MSPQFDVAVIGAGVAGTSVTAQLLRQQLRVVCIDSCAKIPDVFRAEKLEPDQIRAADRLGAGDQLRRMGVHIPSVVDARGGKILACQDLPQIGLRYGGIVAALNASMPELASVRRTGRVQRIEQLSDGVRVRVLDEEPIEARLVVMATGGAKHMTGLSFRRKSVEDLRSTTFGWDVERADGAPFPFDALTVYPDNTEDRLAFVSFFRVPGAVRVNLFTYIDPADPDARNIRTDPSAYLRRVFRNIDELTGTLVATSKVEVGPISLEVTVDPARDFVVLAGDASQTVCPTTGTGLSKALNDAEVLAALIPGWLRSGGATAARIAEYYADPQKIAVDQQSIRQALYRRKVSLDESLKMRLHRERAFMAMRLEDRRVSAMLAPVKAVAWRASAVLAALFQHHSES